MKEPGDGYALRSADLHRQGDVSALSGSRRRGFGSCTFSRSSLSSIGSWETIRTYWGRLTTAATSEPAISIDTEYFCPMDPGILSDWPSKCPVCNMTLVRRKRGEAVPLPEGVMARMQFTPYRLWLGGIRTEAVDFAPLARTLEVPGTVHAVTPGHARVEGEIFAASLPGSRWAKRSRSFRFIRMASRRVPAKIREVPKAIEAGSTGKVIVAVLGREADVAQPGERVRIRVRCPVERFEPFRSQPSTPPTLVRGEPRRLYTCMEHADVVRETAGDCPRDGLALMERPLREDQRVRWWCPMHPAVTAERSGAKCEACGGMVLMPRVVSYRRPGTVLGVPCSAVIDDGSRSLVYIDRGAGNVRRQGGCRRAALRCLCFRSFPDLSLGTGLRLEARS